MSHIALGCWLPVGKPNFYHHEEDDNIEAKVDDRPQFPSVFNRLYRVLIKNNNFDEYVTFSPKSRKGFLDETDPYVAYFTNKNPILNNSISNITLRVDSDGFYFLIAKYDESILSEENAFRSLKQYFSQGLMGGELYSHMQRKALDHVTENSSEEVKVTIDEYFDLYKGILNFFQINTILEGLFNYNFNPDVYFNQNIREISIEQRDYTLGHFFENIVGYVLTSKVLDGNESIHKYNSKSSSFRNEVFKFEKQIDETCDNPDGAPQKMALFGFDLLRRFVRGTGIMCLQPIKWNIETCRRFLLKETIRILHRRQPIDQIENPRSKYFQRIDKANPAQVKGYILLLSAKLPLIKNVREYLNELWEDYGGTSTSARTVGEFINSWNHLIRGIDESIHGIENAVENARTEKMLYELEELRAEQEAETELSRAKEHIEWQNFDEEESFKLSSNGVMLALLGIIVTFIIYPTEVTLFFAGKVWSDQITAWIQQTPTLINFIVRILSIVILLFILYPLIQLIGFRLVQYMNKIEKIWKSVIKNPESTKYQFEIDARIDLEISKTTLSLLRRAEFGFEEGQEKMKVNHLMLIRPKNNTYRVERTSDDEALHKFHFITSAFWEKDSTNLQNPEMRCHLIYEILSHKIADQDSFILREVRFISTTRGLLQLNQQDELKNTVIDRFVNHWLGQAQKLNPEDAIYSILYRLTPS